MRRFALTAHSWWLRSSSWNANKEMVGVACPRTNAAVIHVSSTATGSDDVTVGQNTMTSDFCDQIDFPAVEEVLKDQTPLERSSAQPAVFMIVQGAWVTLSVSAQMWAWALTLKISSGQ